MGLTCFNKQILVHGSLVINKDCPEFSIKKQTEITQEIHPNPDFLVESSKGVNKLWTTYQIYPIICLY